MNNPFDYTPSPECDAAFGRLVAGIESLRGSDKPSDIDFIRELDAGKMLGVLIAEDSEATRHTLYAFSGQIGVGGFHRDGFMGPVFDYLKPDGYFKTREADISRQNYAISQFCQGPFARANADYQKAKKIADARVDECRASYRSSKSERDERRASGLASDEELAAMTKQSQFEKAELHRLKKRLAAEMSPLGAELDKARETVEAMKKKRHADSEALQQWLFSNFILLNARGESRSLSDIFEETPFGVPPSGAGECCAPKLLQAAYLNHWTPVAMAEYWYGAPKEGEVRIHGRHYPACRGKCLPILSWMLEGLDIDPPLDVASSSVAIPDPKIIFENEWFCVVDKPSGMLSVPGKGSDLSVQEWLAEKYGPAQQVRMAHRLDQDTSGLLVAAFGDVAYKSIQTLFARRDVSKTYVALLDGDYIAKGLPRSGRIDLPLSPDWLDRPRQRVDTAGGKEAATAFQFTGTTPDGRSRVVFHPLSGRTHQLRVHAASNLGLGMPISGDRLYGLHPSSPPHLHPSRLLLHAHILEFTFPADGNRYRFESPVPF